MTLVYIWIKLSVSFPVCSLVCLFVCMFCFADFILKTFLKFHLQFFGKIPKKILVNTKLRYILWFLRNLFLNATNWKIFVWTNTKNHQFFLERTKRNASVLGSFVRRAQIFIQIWWYSSVFLRKSMEKLEISKKNRSPVRVQLFLKVSHSVSLRDFSMGGYQLASR